MNNSCGPIRRWGVLGVTAGIVAVTTASGTAAAQQGGAPIPGSAKALMVGTLGVMLFILGLVYFFMKYGGDYEANVER